MDQNRRIPFLTARLSREQKLLAALLVAVLVFYSSVAPYKPVTGDEAAHSNAALFFYRIAAHVAASGFSPSGITSYAADYHAHYKVFTTISVYPPLYYMISVPFIAILGPWAVTSKIVVILEALLVLYLVFLTARLFTKNRTLPFAAVLFLALHPVFSDIATKNYLDMGVTALLTGGIYFFVRYLREKKPGNLYVSAAFMGLSLAAKPMLPVVAAAIMLAIFFIPLLMPIMKLAITGKKKHVHDTILILKKTRIIKKDGKLFLKALLVLAVFSTPLILQQAAALYVSGSQDFISDWTARGGQENKILPSFEPGEPVFAWNSHEVRTASGQPFTDMQEFTKNASAFFFQPYLFPFFLFGAFRAARGKYREIGLISVFMILIVLYLFSVRIHVNSLKHLVIALPSVALLSAAGLTDFFHEARKGGFRKFAVWAVAAFAALSFMQACTYLSAMSAYPTTENFMEVASYVNSISEGPATVLVSQDMAHVFSFAVTDSEMNIYTIFMPRNATELSMAAAGDFSYCDTSSWERFGIAYPPPSYAVVNERWVGMHESGYGMDYFTSRPEKFQLLKAFEGNVPDDMTYVFGILE